MSDIYKLEFEFNTQKADSQIRKMEQDLGSAFSRVGASVSKKPADAIDKIGKSSSNAALYINKLSGALGAVGVPLALGGILKGFESIAGAVAQLEDRAGHLNTTTTDLQLVMSNLTKNGMKDMSAHKALLALNSAMDELERGTDKGVDAFARLGLEAKDLQGLTLPDTLALIRDQIEKIGDSPALRKSLVDIFGSKKLASEILPALKEFNGELSKTDDLMISEENVKRWGELDDQFARLKTNGLAGLATGLGWVAEQLTKIIKDLADAPKFIANLANLPETMAKAVDELKGAGGGSVYDGFKQFVRGQEPVNFDPNAPQAPLTGQDLDSLTDEEYNRRSQPSELTPGARPTGGFYGKDLEDLTDAQYDALAAGKSLVEVFGEQTKEIAKQVESQNVKIVLTSQEIRLAQTLADQERAALMQRTDSLGQEKIIQDEIKAKKEEILKLSSSDQGVEETRVSLAKARVDLVKSEMELYGVQEKIKEEILQKEKDLIELKKKQEAEEKKKKDEQEREQERLMGFVDSYDTTFSQVRKQKEETQDANKALELGLITQEEHSKVMDKINSQYEKFKDLNVGQLSRMSRDPNVDVEKRDAARKEMDKRLKSGVEGDGESAVSYVEAFKIGAEDTVETWGSTASQMVEIGAHMTNVLSDGMTNYFNEFVSGTMSAKEAFSGFAMMVLQELQKMLIQALIVKPIMDGIMGGLGLTPTTPAPAAAPVAVGHTGGTVGQMGSIRRFHTGGLVGDEVPVIARRGEKILSQQDQPAGSGTTESKAPTILNVYDPAMIGRYIAENPEAIVNVIGANRTKVNAVLGK